MRTRFNCIKYTYIYGLTDPVTNQLRYVGKSNDPQQRFKAHLFECASGVKTRKNRWVLGLKKRGFSPNLILIDKVDCRTWQESECFWIAYFRFIGCDLTNGTFGGEGASKGHRHSEETKRKMSEKAKGDNNSQRRKVFTEADRQRMSEISKKRVFTEEYRGNLSKAFKGRVVSEETRRKMSEARKGKPSWNKGVEWSPESREKMSIGHKKISWKYQRDDKGRYASKA